MTTVIEVPASQPAVVRKPEGDAGETDVLAESLYTAAGRYEEVSDEARQLQGVSGWYGSAYDAYTAAATEVATEHSAMQHTVRRVARSVTSYADTLRDLTRDWEGIVDVKVALDERRRTLLADIEATVEPSENDIAALRERSVDLRADYYELATDHDALHRRARESEDLLRQAFQAGTSLDDALSAEGGRPQVAQDAMSEPGAPGTGASPEQVNAWWEGLSEEEREAVIAAYPHLIGPADGLPAGVRDEANRILLDDDLASLGAKDEDGTISEDEREILDNAEAAQEALAEADRTEDPLTGDPVPGSLWLYDPGAFDGDGRIAVAVGDLDTATDVAVMTPGISTDMSDAPKYAGLMGNVYEATRYNGDGSSVATMFWLGYDAPTGPLDTATMTEGRAEDGGERLSDAFDGLRASREDDPAHMTAIGHSYGSTATSYAAGDFDLPADEVVLIGSPGAGPADNADDFSVGEDHVYVGRDSRDLVTTLGDEGLVGKFGVGLGTDPSSEDFDANRFEAEDVDRSWHINSGDAHGSYLNHDTESLYNIAQVVDGHGADVNGADQSYDPWLSGPVDPEWDRDPTADEAGRSDTVGQQ